jgi:signal transduction histidine kinase
MTAITYVRLIGFSAGTLVHLFLLVLIIGYRRPRQFERVLFFLALSLFLFYAGLLLKLNSEIYYATPPIGTLAFAVILVAAGLAFLPAILVHLHVAYRESVQGRTVPGWLKAFVWANYLPGPLFAAFGIHSLFEAAPMNFLRPGGRIGFAYGLWLGTALLASFFFEWRFAAEEQNPRLRGFYRALMVFFAVASPLVVYTYVFGGPGAPLQSVWFTTSVMLASILPSALLGYFVLRFNFLEIGGQRNLVYAVSAAFVAVMYLAVVRRVETWLDPILPPEATAGILLFVLVIFFEPLQRRVGRGLHRSLRRQMDRLQRLTSEFQQEARRGDLDALLAFAEQRIRDEFGLAAVQIRLAGARSADSAAEDSRDVKMRPFPLGKRRQDLGALEAAVHGAGLSGETSAALEFLAEQLPGAIDLCRVIEEKLALERELAERERLALLGQMAASISHNLKNPLGSMKTVLQVQLENPALPADLRKDCELVVGEIDRLSAKLNQLLHYAKPSVRSGAASQRVAAAAVAGQVVTLLRRDAERRNVKLELVAGAEENFVRGTEEALSDVLTNLVVNAIEVLPSGGAISVRLTRNGRQLEIEVIDDGPGIPSEFRSKIFQPFFTTKPSGTGLGLAIVERRLAEMQGAIRWECPAQQSGRGTRFVLSLPLAE